jgi:preprotein translocase subunit SecB
MPKRKTKRTPTRTAIAEDGYTGFLRSVELFGIAVIDSEFQVDRDKYFEEEDKSLSVLWKCQPTEVGDDYFEADARLSVKLRAGKEANPLLKLDATFRLHMHAPKPLNREFIDRFADSEVKIIIWPYFREYVTSVCGRMHIPQITLPFAATG